MSLKPSNKKRKISIEDIKIKTEVARLLNESFDRIPNLAGRRIKVLNREIQKRLEDKFGCSLMTKQNFIDQSVNSLILSGSFQQNGCFACGMESNENYEPENVDNVFVFAFQQFQQPEFAVPQQINYNKISNRVLKNAVTELVRAALKETEEVSESIIRETIEKRHSCDLTSSTDFIMQIIMETLKPPDKI